MTESVVIEEKKSHSADWKSLAVKASVLFLALVLVAEVLFYLVYVPATSRVRLQIEGSASLGYDEMCSLAGLSGFERWISFDSAAVASRLAANPLFSSVSVDRYFPDRVTIRVRERVPVAVALGTVDGRMVPFEIDQNGVAFRFGKTCSSGSLPLLTGLTFENPLPGMRLNSRLKPLLDDLARLELSHPDLLSSLSEIKIVEKTYGGYDLVLYPVHTPVRVRTDKALNQDALQYMMLVLDVVKDMELPVDEIDIRAGTVAYRIRENTI